MTCQSSREVTAGDMETTERNNQLLRERLTSLMEEKQSLSEKINQLLEHEAQHVSSISNLNSELRALKSTLGTCNMVIQELRNEVHNGKDIEDRLTALCEENEGELIRCRDSFRKANANTEHLVDALAKAEKIQTSSRLEVQEVAERLTQVENEKNVMERATEQVRRDLRDAQSSLRISGDRIIRLEALLNELRERNLQLEQSLREAKQRHQSDFDAEVLHMEKKVAELEVLWRERVELARSETKGLVTSEVQRSMRSDHERAFSEMCTHHAEQLTLMTDDLESYKTKLLEHQNRYAYLEVTISDLTKTVRDELATNICLKKEIDERNNIMKRLRQELEDALTETSNAKEDNQNLRETLKENTLQRDALMDQQKKFEGRVSFLEEEATTLHQELEKERRNCFDLEQTLVDIKSQFATVSKELIASAVEARSLKSKLTATEINATSQATTLSSLDEKVQELELQLAESRVECDALTQLQNENIGTINSLKRKEKSKGEYIIELETNLETQEQENQELLSKHESYEERIKELAEQLEIANNQLKEYQVEHELLQENVTSAKQQIVELGAENVKFTEEKSKIQGLLLNQTKELAHSSTEVEQLSAERDKLKFEQSLLQQKHAQQEQELHKSYKQRIDLLKSEFSQRQTAAQTENEALTNDLTTVQKRECELAEKYNALVETTREANRHVSLLEKQLKLIKMPQVTTEDDMRKQRHLLYELCNKLESQDKMIDELRDENARLAERVVMIHRGVTTQPLNTEEGPRRHPKKYRIDNGYRS